VDSQEQDEIPPFGYELDSLTYGGIYRQVSLRAVPKTYIADVFAFAQKAMSVTPDLMATVTLDQSATDR